MSEKVLDGLSVVLSTATPESGAIAADNVGSIEELTGSEMPHTPSTPIDEETSIAHEGVGREDAGNGLLRVLGHHPHGEVGTRGILKIEMPYELTLPEGFNAWEHRAITLTDVCPGEAVNVFVS